MEAMERIVRAERIIGALIKKVIAQDNEINKLKGETDEERFESFEYLARPILMSGFTRGQTDDDFNELQEVMAAGAAHFEMLMKLVADGAHLKPSL